MAALSRRAWLVRLLLVLVLLLGLWLAYQAGWLEPEAVQDRVAQAGIWGPLVFVAVYAVLALLPVPLSLFTVLAGAVFGGLWGVVVVWVGAMLGSLTGFFLARSTIRPMLQPVVDRHRSAVWGYLEGTGVWPVLTIRLMPVAPFMAVNYVAGATGIPLVSYVVGTAVGMLPAVVLYVQVGASGLADPARLLWALAGIVVLIVVGYLLAHRHQRAAGRRAAQPAPSDGDPPTAHGQR
ncbi:MAG TPA: TVP38/TMEM64 family protein [Ornithinimicrobium sp.]|uniref:TVP38/TMEM64 family protein n=1 Tax=Ornithinimicrobium sp. TaxID=1977084 RepID=UPI002B4A2A9E|nr:TVP38/TMEM64 family protein [Ornithinimicrobium sp.]HKJ11172.1 TVP38/TMEM64 family protein [Ornithinimicrobium sp.]